MATPTFRRCALACGWLLTFCGSASAQIVETVGSRALGMGGAFVAVANDSSATWWNPGGLADGPFLDIVLARAVTERTDALPASRDRAGWFALGTPPFGFSYYRLRATDAQPQDPTAEGMAGRQRGVPVHSWSATQVGATFVHSLLPGVHLGSTIKYVRGTVRSEHQDGPRTPADLLGLGEEFEGGAADGRFDLDIGVLAVVGPVRLGGVVRNVREPEFGAGEYRLPRQVRVGAAVDIEKAGGPPLMIAVDADLRTYLAASGERRVVAVGAEEWLWARRVGLRTGVRVNRVGAAERSVTGGVSVAIRSGLYLDAHVVRGGAPDERGWGAAARVSF